MKCKHQFFGVLDISKMNSPAGSGVASTGTYPISSHSFTQGVQVVCADCGEVRAIYADGEVRIIVDKSKT
jgi:hypothetical protein